MLRKLIKYDFRALNRYLIVIHIMLLVTAVLGRLMFIERIIKENPDSRSDMGAVIMLVGIVLYVILFMTAVFGTLLLVAIHFYKNLYSDEGYLTHTLPVSRGQLLISKTFSGSVWTLVDISLVILSMMILMLYKPTIKSFMEHKDAMLMEMGFPATVGYGTIILVIISLFLVSAVSNVVVIYVSITVGQLFSNHRVLGSVVVYFCISTVISIISGIVGANYSISAATNVADNVSVYVFMKETCLFAMVFSLITTVGFYVVTYLLMQKKLNLN